MIPFGIALPGSFSLGSLLLYTAVLSFIQSLLRDLAILIGSSRKDATAQSGLCLCAESALGMTILLISVILIFAVESFTVYLDHNRLISWFALFLLASFAIKDYVVMLNPLRIVKNPDHLNIFLSFKK